MAKVDLKTAALILDRAFLEAQLANDEKDSIISDILHGSHKTYRYVLVTSLLGKATNNNVNILSMQKGKGKNVEEGNYDARTLCHKVLVPFETLKLPGSLGCSNEPYLNKPARFVSLSLQNAVRKGKDYETLSRLIDFLSSIKDSEEAYLYLKAALYFMKEISADYIAKFSIGDTLIDISEFSQLVLDYIYELSEISLEGEVCPLIVAQLEQMYLGKDYQVIAHKVNESGTSSKEIGDIDVYNKHRELLYSIEVKDKDFTEQDVLHAIRKFKEAGLDTSLFIYGKKVNFDEKEVFAALKQIGREGHYCCLISIFHYAKLRIADLKTLTLRDFVSGLLVFAKVINAKNETIHVIKELSKRVF